MEYISLYPKSFCLYIGLGAVVVLLAFLAQKSPQKVPVSLVLIILTLTLFSGLRGVTVGIDTSNYIDETIVPILMGKFNVAYGEIGFKLLVKLFVSILPTYTAVFLGLSLLIVVLLVGRFWELREKINFIICILGFYCIVYLSIFNTIRQLLSVAIVFWGTRFLFKKNYVLYGVTILLGTSVHTTGLIGIVLVLIYEMLSKEKLTPQKIIIRIILIIGVFYAGMYIFKMDRVQFYVNKYAKSDVSLGGLMAYFEIVLILGIECIDRLMNQKYSFKSSGTHDNIETIAKISYLTGLILRILGYKYLYLGRLGDLFCIFQFVYYGNLNCSILKKQMKISAITVLSLYTIFSVVGSNGYGIMPYSIYN